MLEALEKLRTAARNMAKGSNLENHDECNLLLIIADEIQAEIDESYMLLPVDADGAPIHVGDWMDGDCPSGKHVNGYVSYIGDGKFYMGNVSFYLRPEYMHHFKPRTVEDVLNDYAKDVYEHGQDMHDVEKYANEIRKLLGGDAE